MTRAEKIAAIVKGFRQSCSMKAETLSALSGLSLRTIERVESGKHAPNQQTLNLIAKAFKVEPHFFDEGYWDSFQKSAEDAAKHKTLVPIHRVESTKSVFDWIKSYHATTYNLEIADKDEEALEKSLCFVESMRDYCDLFGDIPIGGIHDAAKELAEIGNDLLGLGYHVKIGSYKAQEKSGRPKPLVFDILLLLVVPKDNVMEFALVTHQDGWENTKEPLTTQMKTPVS